MACAVCSKPVQLLGHRAGGSGTSVLLLLEGMCRGSRVNGSHTMLAFFSGQRHPPREKAAQPGAQAGALAATMALFPILRLVTWS